MKADIMRKFVKALRSGEYVQIIGAMVREGETLGACDGFCAVGVLLDLYARDKGRDFSADPTTITRMRRWAGMRDDSVVTIINWNDFGVKFSRLATMVKERYKSL